MPIPWLLVALLLSNSAAAQTLTPFNYGVIEFGQSLASAERRLGEHATPRNKDESCDFVAFARYPRVKFMVEAGVVTRADATGTVRNSAAIALGTPLEVAKARFPSARIEPHKYDEHGHYFILDTPSKKAALLFEEGDGRLTEIRAGLQPSVEYVEGCL